jgi:hypothetical protein
MAILRHREPFEVFSMKKWVKAGRFAQWHVVGVDYEIDEYGPWRTELV